MKPEFSPQLRRYLRQVMRHLTLSRAAKQRIRNDLATSIAGKLESGMTEDAILQELGQPEAIAAELNAQMGQRVPRRSPWRFVPLLLSIVSAVILLGQLALQLLFRSFSGANVLISGAIGGADGPTAIFVTTANSGQFDWELLIWLLLLFAGLAGYFLLRRDRNQED